MCLERRIRYDCPRRCEVITLQPCEHRCYQNSHPGDITQLPLVVGSIPESPEPTPSKELPSYRELPTAERGVQIRDQSQDRAQQKTDPYRTDLAASSQFDNNDAITLVRQHGRQFPERYLRIGACERCEDLYGGGIQATSRDRTEYLVRLETYRSRAVKAWNAFERDRREEQRLRLEKKEKEVKGFRAWIKNATGKVIKKSR